MKRFTQLLGLSVVLVMMLALIVGVANAQDDDVIVISWEQEPPNLYPLNNMAFASLLEDFYMRGTWDWDYNYQIYPIKVTEIPTLDNGMVTENDQGNTVVTYHLREGMLWSDGTPITSADCELYHRLYSDRTTSANIVRGNYPDVVESFEAVDDLTFVLTYNQPWPDYLVDAWNDCSYPAHILNPILDAEGTIDNAPFFTSAEGVVGYGPYVLDEWIVGDTMTFSANPNWDGTPPAIERVIIKQIPELPQALSALETGEVDMTYNWSPDMLADYQAVSDAAVFATPGVFMDAVWINVLDGHPALQDLRVRQAIGYALDRPAMAEGLVAPGVTVPKSWYHAVWQPEDLPALAYDPDMANQLLDEAGWVDSDGDGIRDKDGTNLILRFFTTTRQIRMDYQVLIQEYLSAVGIGTQLLPVPAGIMFDTYANRGITGHRDFDLALFALSNSPLTPNGDASTFHCEGIASAENPDGNNYMGWCDEEYDDLDNLVFSTVDPEERLGYTYDAVRRWTEAYFWHGLYVRDTYYAVNSDRFDAESVEPNLGTLSSNYFERVELFQPVG